MKTETITFLCCMSDRVRNNAETANNDNFKTFVRGLTINSTYSQIKLDFDDYPELKPVAEKLINYLIKSEEAKQNEIKVAIAKEL